MPSPFARQERTQLFPAPDCPKTKLSGRNSCPRGPEPASPRQKVSASATHDQKRQWLTDHIHRSGLEIDEHGTGDVLTARNFIVVDVDALELEITRSLVPAREDPGQLPAPASCFLRSFDSLSRAIDTWSKTQRQQVLPDPGRRQKLLTMLFRDRLPYQRPRASVDAVDAILQHEESSHKTSGRSGHGKEDTPLASAPNVSTIWPLLLLPHHLLRSPSHVRYASCHSLALSQQSLLLPVPCRPLQTGEGQSVGPPARLVPLLPQPWSPPPQEGKERS